MLSSSQSLGTALRSSVADRSRVHARALAREIEARGLLLRERAGPAPPHGRDPSARAGARHGERLHPRGRDPGRGGPAAARDRPRRGRERSPGRGGPRGPRGLRHRGLRGRRAGARLRPGARTRRAASSGAVVVSTFLAPAVAADAREVQERYTKFRKALEFREPIKAVYLSLFLFPALLVPVRGGLAVALSRGAHHQAGAAGGGGRRAHRRGRAGRARGLPVRERRVHRPHRLLQPHVRAAGPQRRGGRARPRATSCGRTRSWTSGGGSWRPCSRPWAPASWWWTTRAPPPP